MKHLFLFLLFISLSVLVFAQPISKQEAEKLGAKYESYAEQGKDIDFSTSPSDFANPFPKFGVNGIASGSVELDLLMGVNNQINKYERDETSLTGEIVDYGTNSFDIGGNLLYYIRPFFALGFSFSYTGLNNSNYNLHTPGAEYSLYQEEDYKLRRFSYFLVGKINPLENNKFRVYVPFGAGFVTYSREKREYTRYIYPTYSWDTSFDSKSTHTKPALFAGLGLEYNVSTSVVLGLEWHYNVWFYNPKSDENRLKYQSFLAKVGFIFN